MLPPPHLLSAMVTSLGPLLFINIVIYVPWSITEGCFKVHQSKKITFEVILMFTVRKWPLHNVDKENPDWVSNATNQK